MGWLDRRDGRCRDENLLLGFGAHSPWQSVFVHRMVYAPGCVLEDNSLLWVARAPLVQRGTSPQRDSLHRPWSMLSRVGHRDPS